jgi:hypothetical protein
MTTEKPLSAEKRWLVTIKREQPSSLSGGRTGIQNLVYFVGPHEQRHRVLLKKCESPLSYPIQPEEMEKERE